MVRNFRKTLAPLPSRQAGGRAAGERAPPLFLRRLSSSFTFVRVEFFSSFNRYAMHENGRQKNSFAFSTANKFYFLQSKPK